eukprot:134779-Hanusia_phi.AAC.5
MLPLVVNVRLSHSQTVHFHCQPAPFFETELEQASLSNEDTLSRSGRFNLQASARCVAIRASARAIETYADVRVSLPRRLARVACDRECQFVLAVCSQSVSASFRQRTPGGDGISTRPSLAHCRPALRVSARDSRLPARLTVRHQPAVQHERKGHVIGEHQRRLKLDHQRLSQLPLAKMRQSVKAHAVSYAAGRQRGCESRGEAEQTECRGTFGC